MTEKALIVHEIANYSARIAICVCITVTAIHFNDARLLAWYLAPILLMSVNYYSKEERHD